MNEVFRRLALLPPARSFGGAWTQLASILNQVEDEWTNIACNPALWRVDGRMYLPPIDTYRRVMGQPRMRVFRTRNHRIFIGLDGAIRVCALDGTVVFDKAGGG